LQLQKQTLISHPLRHPFVNVSGVAGMGCENPLPTLVGVGFGYAYRPGKPKKKKKKKITKGAAF